MTTVELLEAARGLIATKVCTRCGEEKQLTEFYRRAEASDGRQSACKRCRATYHREWAKNNRARAYQYVNAWRRRHPERNRLEQQRIRATLKGKARKALQHAVEDGKLTKPEACERCDSTPGYPLHGHHKDYSRPFDVGWVCARCHSDLHRSGA